MANIICLSDYIKTKYTTQTEFINGNKKLFTKNESFFEHERGYRFRWGNLSEHKNPEATDVVYFGIRWSQAILDKCYQAGMSEEAIIDATMMYLPDSGKSTDVWADDIELNESGAFLIDLGGEEGLSERELKKDVWKTYVSKMDLIAKEIFDIAERFKHDETYIVKKMIDPDS